MASFQLEDGAQVNLGLPRTSLYFLCEIYRLQARCVNSCSQIQMGAVLLIGKTYFVFGKASTARVCSEVVGKLLSAFQFGAKTQLIIVVC